MATHYSGNKDFSPLEGGCVCGLVRYAIGLPPLLVHCCSCTACQRQTGTILALNAIVESSALTLLPSGPPTIAGTRAAPEPIPAGIMPAFTRTASATSALDHAGKGKPVAVCIPTESGVGQVITQCPSCRTTLWNHYADAGEHLSYVRVGTLDRAWELEPDVHLFTRNRPAWLKTEDGKPSFEGYYPDRTELFRPQARERMETLRETVEGWQVGMYGRVLGSK